MSFLPKRAQLRVDKEKLVGYLLNPNHRDGKTKAKFFRNRGFQPDHWKTFAAALKQHGQTQQITEEEKTRHGRKFEVQCNLVTPDGKNPCILTVWIQATNRPPRLVTAHPHT